MKKRNTILLSLQGLLAVGVVFVLYWNYALIEKPVRFEAYKESRMEAVKNHMEKYLIPLTRAYRDADTAKLYTTDWDALINFALNDTIEYRSKIYDENNLKYPEIEAAMKAKDPNWTNDRVVRVAARDTRFDDVHGRAMLTEAEIRDLRYIPNSNEKEFMLDTASMLSGNTTFHLIRCHAPYVDFLSMDEFNQEIWNMLNDEFEFMVNNSEASEQFKKMKSEGLKECFGQKPATNEKGEVIPGKFEPKYLMGENNPIPFDIEYFGLTFGSLENVANESCNWKSGGAQ